MRRWADPGDEFSRRAEFSRRRVLQGALLTAAAAATANGVDGWATQASARDKRVILPPGTRPDPSKPEGAESMPEIEHIVIYMNENHSFDSYYGVLGRGDGYTIGRDGLPVNFSPLMTGKPIRVYHQTDPCDPVTGDHSWNGEHISWNHGKMDGFVQANTGTTGILGYYDEAEIPFYYSMAKTFPICDRWFSSILGPTHPNRRYLQAGTSAGMVVTSAQQVIEYPTCPNGTIWDRLNAHGITWKDYCVADIGDIFLYPGHTITAFLTATVKNRSTSPTGFLADCRNGTLPQVSIIAPGVSTQYDEGSQDVQNGEAYSYSIINAVMDSPLWEKTMLFFTYDEAGGCYDHVPPPPAVAPDNIPPRITVPPTQPGTFAQLGIRVTGFVISPYAKRDYVSHVVHDHTSILKFIETKYNLGAMTYRDANADNLLDCVDFTKLSFREPPAVAKPNKKGPTEALPAEMAFLKPVRFAKPGLPAGGSVCEPQPRPGVNPIPKDAVSYKKVEA